MAVTTRVVTGRVRLSYPHLFEPHAFADEEPKYSVMILIPKSDTATLRKIKEAQAQALKDGIGSVFGGKTPKEMQYTLKDGDDDADEYPERADHWVMTVRSKVKPGVVDQNVNPILNQSEVYPGMYARVSMNAFPYKYGGKSGVSFGLGNVQKVADGEPLGGTKPPEADFGPVDSVDTDLI